MTFKRVRLAETATQPTQPDDPWRDGSQKRLCVAVVQVAQVEQNQAEPARFQKKKKAEALRSTISAKPLVKQPCQKASGLSAMPKLVSMTIKRPIEFRV